MGRPAPQSGHVEVAEVEAPESEPRKGRTPVEHRSRSRVESGGKGPPRLAVGGAARSDHPWTERGPSAIALRTPPLVPRAAQFTELEPGQQPLLAAAAVHEAFFPFHERQAWSRPVTVILRPATPVRSGCGIGCRSARYRNQNDSDHPGDAPDRPQPHFWLRDGWRSARYRNQNGGLGRVRASRGGGAGASWPRSARCRRP